MKSIFLLRVAAGMACGILTVLGMAAKTGAPHTVKAVANYTDVSLTWCKPADVKELRWHSNKDYNGDTAPLVDNQKTVKTWVASKFTASDLENVVGENVEAISFFQYRPAVSVTVQLRENEKVVAEANADMAKYEKNTWQAVSLPTPYKLQAGKDYMFVVCYETGSNMDFVAIKDEAANAVGKGDLLSTNGKDWTATAGGEYLITGILTNDVTEEPTGYNVYSGSNKLNDELITDLTASFKRRPAGAASYSVSAVYEGGEHKSYTVGVTHVDMATMLPTATFLSSSVDMLDVNLEWTKPLAGGNELTWSDKSAGISIGGTATSNTKVWVRNQFTASDLIGFRGGKLTAVNYKFIEAVVTEATIFIFKDGVLNFYEKVSADDVAAIKAGEWAKFKLSEPYQLEEGHAYDYGLYVIHTPKMHPMGVDNSTTIDVKGNSFSVSSPNSTNFLNSKPSWKTLKSGGMEGNWLMTADVEGSPAPAVIESYDVYRDGTLVGNTKELKYTDTVTELGKYKYSLVSRGGEKVSPAVNREVNVKLPAAYTAPLLENSTFDSDTKELAISWNMDKEISHCGQAYAKASFEEEMPLMWGTQFTAAELSDYKGYSISKLKIMIGDEIGALKVGVYTAKGVAVSEIEIPAETLTPQAIYTVKLPKTVEVTGEEPLVLAYSATIPAGKGGIIVDQGPLVDGGAKISLTDGKSWLNLSTLNPTYGNYNVFISAMASEAIGSNAPAKTVELGNSTALVSYKASADKVYGVESLGTSAKPKKAANGATPKVDHFNIYANGEKVGESKSYEYAEKVARFASFDYYVTTVYTNGWESAASETVSFTNRIAQKGVAPYGLNGVRSGSDLKLEWQSPENSVVYTYVPKDATMMALKMTGGTALTSYCAAKFPVEELKDNVGDYITHIQIGAANPEITSIAVFVMAGENIIYTQTVPLSTVVTGVNDIRLNEPVKILPGTDMSVGFLMKYPSSASHPLGCFECMDHDGTGDLISSSGSSWKTLHTGLKSNYCWWVKGIVGKADQNLAAAPARVGTRAAAKSYNVYHDGILVETITETSYVVKNAVSGRYYVTAVDGENESAESNAVEYTGTSGVNDLTADYEEAVIYDAARATIVSGAPAVIKVYNMNGVCVAGGEGITLNVADLSKGIYTAQAAFANGSSVVIKFAK